ncbi:hypothetical protein [Cellulomonas xiejunii]|uniref:hypothetical protein n=1 Tax=Cellulomonas xiejunii TaxID=2968083 RepID=UPI001D0EE749|nr:hypothetical protein [Cellulomonas xiejunii]MCC2312847.1 hypothetical protein [Cellulomonas xiejunii]
MTTTRDAQLPEYTPEEQASILRDDRGVPVGVVEKPRWTPAKVALWVAISLVGALGWTMLAIVRGERVNTIWFVVTAVATYAIAYRFYALSLAMDWGWRPGLRSTTPHPDDSMDGLCAQVRRARASYRAAPGCARTPDGSDAVRLRARYVPWVDGRRARSDRRRAGPSRRWTTRRSSLSWPTSSTRRRGCVSGHGPPLERSFVPGVHVRRGFALPADRRQRPRTDVDRVRRDVHTAPGRPPGPRSRRPRTVVDQPREVAQHGKWRKRGAVADAMIREHESG